MSSPSAALCLLLLSASATAAWADKAPVYALTGGRVVTVSGSVQEAATVLLRDGVIEAVGPGTKIPPDARVIDVKGLTVTPGLIDGFGGVGLPAAPPRGPGAGAAAAAPPRDNPLSPQALVLDKIRVADALKARDHGFTTALVVPRDGVLPGRSVLLSLSGDTPEQMAWRQPAALHVHMASLARQYPGSLMGTVAYVRQQMYDARRYRELWTAYEKAPAGRKRPAYDAALDAWNDVLSGRIPLIVTVPHENDVRRALALADEFKVKVIVAGGGQAARVAELLKSRKLPLLLSVNFDPPRAATFFGGADDDRDRREIEEAERTPAELHKAGVAFALVSGHAPNAMNGVRKAVERGLPREAALRALTLGAAEALGIADRTGSLDAGKAANVAVWSGDPLTKDAKVKMLFVDGKLYEPDPAPAAGPGGGKPDEDKKAADKPEGDKPAAPAARGNLPPAPPARDASFAIMGATLLTAGPQGTIEKGTILVKDGKIAAIGASVDLPSGLPVVNATGQFAMPGIIDAHSHTAIEGNVNECTDNITAEVRVTDVIDQRDVNVYRELAGGVTTVNVLHGSCNAIGGQNAVLKMRWGRSSPADLLMKEAPRGVKFALGENPKRANFNAPGARRYPGTRMGVEALIRKSFEDAKAYRREWADYEQKAKVAGPKGDKPVPPRTDLRLQELVDILDGKVLVHAHCYRSDEILMLITVAEEMGFKIRTFQHVLEGYKVAREIAKHGAGASTFSDWWAYKMEAHDAIPYNAAVMASKGVNVSLNSDSDELARRLYWEAAKTVKYGGVPEDEALKMITANPAWQLGIDKQVGTLEVGKDADIAIFNAHPFSPDARVELTLVEGQIMFDRDRDLGARQAAPAGGAK
jgi:imidazolonepropionase-like amidohydrolase